MDTLGPAELGISKYQDPLEQIKARIAADEINQSLKANNKASKAVLAQEDFIKLLTTQLRYQDPMQPMDNKEWVAQMASFSTLQANLDLNKKMDKVNETLTNLSSLALSGKFVEYLNPLSGKLSIGEVNGITFSNEGIPQVDINGESIGVDSIRKVQDKDQGDVVTE